jgi:N-terminal domain of NWD NACHT-NTPase
MTTNDSEQYTAMVAGVEEVVTIVARYQQIEALYLSRPETTLKQEFERRLVSLYKHIIRYQILATCYYRRNTMRQSSRTVATISFCSRTDNRSVRFMRAMPKLDDVSEVIAAIQRDDAACEKIGQVFDSSGRS